MNIIVGTTLPANNNYFSSSIIAILGLYYLRLVSDNIVSLDEDYL